MDQHSQSKCERTAKQDASRLKQDHSGASMHNAHTEPDRLSTLLSTVLPAAACLERPRKVSDPWPRGGSWLRRSGAESVARVSGPSGLEVFDSGGGEKLQDQSIAIVVKPLGLLCSTFTCSCDDPSPIVVIHRACCGMMSMQYFGNKLL